MRQFFTANIARTAVCVALIAILPALVIIAATDAKRYDTELDSARVSGERFVKTLAFRQTQIMEMSETLMQVLARLHDVREGNSEPLSSFFRDLVANAPEYDNVFLLNSTGRVIASALPVPESVDFSRHSFFKRTVRSGAFSVGNVVSSPFTGDPVLIFALPVTFANKENSGVVAVSVNPISYDRVFKGITLADDAVVYFLDGSGAVASTIPKEHAEVGAFLGGEIWRGVQNVPENSGFFGVKKKAGDAIQVVFKKLHMPGMDMPYFYILYTRPEASVFAQAEALLNRDIRILAIVSLLAVLAAASLGVYALRRPWRRLMTAAEGVTNGDLSTRVDLSGIGGEMGALGKEFNFMAEALDKRDKELSAARDYAELSRNAKSEFLANMSHEIRTSMNAILGMAYLVLKTELTAQQKGYITKLLSAANALLRVINDILDFSKMEAGKLAMENIAFSLRRIASTVRSESAARLEEKKLGFDLSIEPDVPDHLLGDPLRLSQALMILVDDAIDRSERGVVSVTCSLIEQDPDHVTLRFAIRDAGVGLTPVQLAELRELFNESPEETSSSLDKLSLRLAIGNRLFRMMGGHIEVSSVFGEGVVCSAYAKFGYAAGELHKPSQFFAGRKALIVDPAPLSRQDIMDILPRFGFSAESAASLEEARGILIQAEKEGAPFSVALIDWRPSRADIPSLVMRLKSDPELFSPPAMVLTTAVGRMDLPASLKEFDIDALLPKPINESLVFDTLMNILGAPAGITPDTAYADSNPLAGVRILLAEDNSVNQQIAAELMEHEGIILSIASNGEEALSMLGRNFPEAFDIILMDLQMPKMDGFAATRAIRSEKKHNALQLPVIAMTAHSDVSEISACFTVGMNDHTSKPIIVEQFFATLKRWLPVRPESAEPLLAAVDEIRELLAKADPDWAVRVEEVLNSLVPHLHEGRVAMIRKVVEEGEDMAIEETLKTITAIVEQLRLPEEDL